MSGQIIFFRKSLCDLDIDETVITVTDTTATNDGSAYVDYMRNRKNDSAWITTGSNDAANTTLEVDFVDSITFSDILLIGHNLAAYTIQYWTGVAWADFSTVIAETANTYTTTHHNFTSVVSNKIKIIITGTQVVDADKYIKQLIVTRRIGNGQLTGWPMIKSPTLSTNKQINKMLSGKIVPIESLQTFSATLSVQNWNIDADMDIIEDIYFRHQGVLIWLCGGDESQFATVRKGYTKEDIYLVRPTDEYSPELYKGIYKTGVKIDLKLAESVN